MLLRYSETFFASSNLIFYIYWGLLSQSDILEYFICICQYICYILYPKLLELSTSIVILISTFIFVFYPFILTEHKEWIIMIILSFAFHSIFWLCYSLCKLIKMLFSTIQAIIHIYANFYILLDIKIKHIVVGLLYFLFRIPKICLILI